MAGNRIAGLDPHLLGRVIDGVARAQHHLLLSAALLLIRPLPDHRRRAARGRTPLLHLQPGRAIQMRIRTAFCASRAPPPAAECRRDDGDEERYEYASDREAGPGTAAQPSPAAILRPLRRRRRRRALARELVPAAAHPTRVAALPRVDHQRLLRALPDGRDREAAVRPGEGGRRLNGVDCRRRGLPRPHRARAANRNAVSATVVSAT